MNQRKSTNKEDRIFRFFELFTEVVAWVQIVASPFLIGLILGAVIYLSGPNITRLVLGIIVAIAGLIIGIIWATKKWKGKGTVWFISRVMATPELDNPEESEKSDKSKQKAN